MSKHLACLRDCGLVTSEPAGRASVFRLAQPALAEMLTAAETVLAATGNAVALCPVWGRDACGPEPVVTAARPAREQNVPVLATPAARRAARARSRGTAAAVRDAGWQRAARLARWLAWASLAWMCTEGATGLWQGLAAGSVALTGWALGSAVEGLASVIVIWRFTGTRALSETAERRAQRGCRRFVLAAGPLYRRRIRPRPCHRPPRAGPPGPGSR